MIGWGFGHRSGGPFESGVFLAVLAMDATVGVLAVLFGRKAFCSMRCRAALIYPGPTVHEIRAFRQSSRVGRYFLGSRPSTAYVVASTGICPWGSPSVPFAKVNFFRLRVRNRSAYQRCATVDCAKAGPVDLVDLPLYLRTTREYRSRSAAGSERERGGCGVEFCARSAVRSPVSWERADFGSPGAGVAPGRMGKGVSTPLPVGILTPRVWGTTLRLLPRSTRRTSSARRFRPGASRGPRCPSHPGERRATGDDGNGGRGEDRDL